ncbi:MAG: DNA polymerase III subunit gamma/tau, partial [Armatimonadota bacterium]
MPYVALYRKYRSQAFEDVIGQEHVTRTLQNAIESQKIGQAYLCAGSRGCGKTT